MKIRSNIYQKIHQKLHTNEPRNAPKWYQNDARDPPGPHCRHGHHPDGFWDLIFGDVLGLLVSVWAPWTVLGGLWANLERPWGGVESHCEATWAPKASILLHFGTHFGDLLEVVSGKWVPTKHAQA